MTWSPWQEFNRNTVSGAPREVGIYAFGDGSNVIYYGKAEQEGGIFARLSQHLNSETNQCIQQNARNVCWQTTFDPAGAERAALDQHLRDFGDLPRCNSVRPRG